MKYFLILFVLLLVFIGYQYVRTKRLIQIGTDLAEKAVPFERIIDDAPMKILVIGDSTAVGTGASSPKDSIAGRVGQTFPEASIKNLGVNGSKTHELIERLEALPDQSFDLIMLHIGGNDVVRGTDQEAVKRDIDRVIKLAKAKGRKVTLTSTGNIGTAPLLPYGSRWLFTKRSREVREILMKAAASNNIPYVDLFREKEEDPFAKDPQKFYAADLFHPSNEGYADWYGFIEPVIVAELADQSQSE